ncbi:MAG: hypothetical protein MUO24_06665 [Desulfobacterales bacterium]|nr:hypothetical protein [Desulfobacterales bacterium]
MLDCATEFLQEEAFSDYWRKIGKKALEKGKHLFSRKCFEKISDRQVSMRPGHGLVRLRIIRRRHGDVESR